MFGFNVLFNSVNDYMKYKSDKHRWSLYIALLPKYVTFFKYPKSLQFCSDVAERPTHGFEAISPEMLNCWILTGLRVLSEEPVQRWKIINFSRSFARQRVASLWNLCKTYHGCSSFLSIQDHTCIYSRQLRRCIFHGHMGHQNNHLYLEDCRLNVGHSITWSVNLNSYGNKIGLNSNSSVNQARCASRWAHCSR